MAEQNYIAVQLSREALVTLLSLLGIDSLVGLGEHYLGGYSDREQEILLQAGANALRARGLLQESRVDGEVQVQFDAALLALAGACATAPRLLFMNYLPASGAPRPWYVHLGAHLTVIHRTTLPGVHELWGSGEPAEVVAEIGRLLQWADGARAAAPAANFGLMQRDLDKVVSLLDGAGRETAVAHLRAVGLAPEEAELLVTAVQQANATCTFALMALQENNEQPLSAFSLLLTDSGLWRLDTADGETLQVRGIAADAVKADLLGWLES